MATTSTERVFTTRGGETVRVRVELSEEKLEREIARLAQKAYTSLTSRVASAAGGAVRVVALDKPERR